MLLEYHQKSIELLGVPPTFSQSQIALINSFEEKYRVKFPASLREWYSIESSFSLLERILGSHMGIELNDAPRIQASCDYLINNSDPFLIAIENQAVWFMAVRFNEGEDPPVYIRYNEPEESWVLHAHSFSDWINALSWDDIVLSKSSENFVSATPETRERLLEFQIVAPETYVRNVYFVGDKFVRMKKDNEYLLVIHTNTST